MYTLVEKYVGVWCRYISSLVCYVGMWCTQVSKYVMYMGSKACDVGIRRTYVVSMWYT